MHPKGVDDHMLAVVLLLVSMFKEPALLGDSLVMRSSRSESSTSVSADGTAAIVWLCF